MSDENTRYLLSNPNYYAANKGANFLEISESILKALNQPVRIDLDLRDSVADYMDGLFKILSDIK